MSEISVIIPYYNGKISEITRAVDSVKCQSFGDFDIIIVDDGSDATLARQVDDLYTDDINIKIIHQINKGVSEARNQGVRRSNSRYVMFLDADDQLLPCCLEDAFGIAERTGADLVIGGVLIDSELKKLKPNDGSIECKVLEGDDITKFQHHAINDWIRIDGGGYIGRGPVSRLVKREILKEVNFDPSLSIGEDIVWNLTIQKKCQKICLFKKVWYLYYTNPASATHRYNPSMLKATKKLLLDVRDLCDLEQDDCYLAYCNLMFESLKQFVVCMVIHPQWNRIPYKKRRQMVSSIYSTLPWTYLFERRLFTISGMKNRVKIILHTLHLLLPLLVLKHKLFNASFRTLIKGYKFGSKRTCRQI